MCVCVCVWWLNPSSRRFGYVDFANAADAAAALEAKNQTTIDGRTVHVDFASARPENGGVDKPDARARTFGDTTSPPTDTLWVGNVSFEANEDVLAEEFGQCGSILQIRLPTDR